MTNGDFRIGFRRSRNWGDCYSSLAGWESNDLPFLVCSLGAIVATLKVRGLVASREEGLSIPQLSSTMCVSKFGKALKSDAKTSSQVAWR